GYGIKIKNNIWQLRQKANVSLKLLKHLAVGHVKCLTGNQVKLKVGAIESGPVRLKAMLIALDLTRLKAIGEVTLIHPTIFLDVNGNALEINLDVNLWLNFLKLNP
ncbi:hypothetical protein EBS02_06975, partial [bacterium]|nr:hypothetical protein [bacterium]